MMEKIDAYIDSYDIITILIDKGIDNEAKRFFLIDGDSKIELELISYYQESEHNKYVARFVPEIILHKDYYIEDEFGHRGYLKSGSIVRNPRFDEIYEYDGPLGAIYTPNETTFRIWTPVAKEVIIEIFLNGKYEEHYLKYLEDENVWEYKRQGDIEGYKYIYRIRVNDEFNRVLDPYALSSGANAEYNYVVDPSKFYKMKNKMPKFSGRYTDAIIYEVSIRDFTQDLTSNNRGCFLGMLENRPTKKGSTGIEYIKSLGVTHVQLLPVFDFEGVDDVDKNIKYNWGYNPVQFFVPCGYYSELPDDPYSRINELLKLIDEFHGAGIRVNFDVVFNHVYETPYLAFGKINPGYDFRVDYSGELSNASGCGNVLATERKAVSRLVKDALKYYQTVFKASGFRFDLMGLLDIDTLNEAEEELRKYDDSVMLYGEGWNMHNPLPEDKRPSMDNYKKIPGYAFFNDKFRDFVRGSQWNKIPGYAFDREAQSYDINNLVLGSCLNDYKFDEPTQSVNYVECHDNYTFYDFGYYSMGLEDYQVIDAARIAESIIMISEGIPFIHAGQEFYRTKQGIENSYRHKGLVNKFNYLRRDKYIESVNMLKDLINIRKKYPVLRLNKSEDIEKNVKVLDNLVGEHRTAFVFNDEKYQLFVIIKTDYRDEVVDFGGTMLLFDGFKKCGYQVFRYTMKKPGVYIFRKDI